MKPKVFKSVLLAVATLLVFVFTFGACRFLVLYITKLMLSVPELKFIVNLFYNIRGDSPSITACIIGGIVSFFVGMLPIAHSKSEEPTNKLAARISGILIIVIGAISLLANIVYHESIIANLVYIVAGIFFVRYEHD